MVRWADPARVEEAVREHAEALRRREPGVSRVIWYGSWVNGTPTPSSDVDLCVVVESDPRRPRDRVPDYLPTRFPVGVDLVVLTEQEFQEMEERAPTWYRAIVSGKTV
ncbi:MAG: nucleotidyltransferase domain-containing protein [bacterium]